MPKEAMEHICPYYKSDTNQTISCEGVVDNSEILTGYESTQCKLRYKTFYCNGCFFRCQNAIMLNNKWNRFEVVRCKYNEGVECVDCNGCSSCGWNPAVAHDRLNRLGVCI